VELDVELGLDGLIPALRPGAWTLLKVRCRLGAQEPAIQGRVVVDRPSKAVSAYAAPVRVEPGGVAAVRLCVPVSLDRAYEVRLEDADGQTLATASPSGSFRPIESLDRMGLLLGKGLGCLGGKSKVRLRVARVTPRELPREARLLSTLAAVFVPGSADPDLRDLCQDPTTLTHLRAYVEGGGRLVFLARPGVPPPWGGTPLEALLPLERLQPHAVERSELGFVLGELEEGQAAVVSGELLPGARWLHQTGSVGLVAERKLGRGRAIHVGFDVDDPVLRSSDKMGKVVGTFAPLRVSATPSRLAEEALADLASDSFVQRASLGTLGFVLLVALLLGHLLILGPVSSLLTKRRGPWHGLLVPPALSLGIGALLLLGSALSEGRTEVRTLEVAVHDPERPGRAWCQLEAGLFAGSEARFEVGLPPHWDPTQQERDAIGALAFRGERPALEFLPDGGARVAPLHVAARGFSQLRLRSQEVGGPALEVEVLPPSGDPAEPEVEVRSFASEPIEGGWVVYMDDSDQALLSALPPVPSGGAVRWRPQGGWIEEDPALAGDPFAGDDVPVDLLAQVAALLRQQYRNTPPVAGGHGRTFPRAWVILVRRDTPSEVELRVAREGAEPERRSLRIDLIPAPEGGA
jgi:hypothetical protein